MTEEIYNANMLTIWARLLPFDASELLKSKAWHQMTEHTQRHLIGALTTFTEIIEKRQEYWHKKGTVKGEFYANVLSDFEWDFVEDSLMNFDNQLESYWHGGADEYADQLIEQAMNYKRWDKILKNTYEKDKDKITDAITDDNGEVDLDAIGDITTDYRDIFY